jgi:CBS domain-containing protein/sporulation protein YlmC with PRC-barrel domain
MPFVSELIGRPVVDLDGETIGSLKDVLAIMVGMPHPRVMAIQVKRRKGVVTIPIDYVAALIAPAVPLNRRFAEIHTQDLTGNHLHLIRDVLDKQIIDTNGVRVVRVNDLELKSTPEGMFVANVDISGAGLARRLGLGGVAQRLGKGAAAVGAPVMISWDNVELLSGDQPMRLKVPGDRMSELHPADLAEILSDLSHQDAGAFLDTLDVETVADALEEVETEFQARLVEDMDDERVADLLEEMSPDEAADLLAELPDDRSAELLKLMEVEEAEDVRKLLTYDEDSAGGIMTTEFVSVSPELTAGQVLDVLRANADEAETIFYVYVVDAEERLLGVFSLRELVLAQPATRVADFMETRVVAVNLEDSQDECGQMVSKYNLLAVPVVDDQRRLQGIVTADDALDKIIPTAWKKRLPRMYR